MQKEVVMGKKGREIVRLNIEELIEDLTRAYADEWLAHYYYTLAANLLQGINSPEIAEKLREISLSEYGHSNKLAERITELGGEPLRAFAEVAQKAACPPFNMPRNPSDIPALINAVLEQERHAIETYQAL
ncbi:MAG: ferritin-like domain-containing protein, partial [Dehalococcoidia bacterium]